MARPVTAAADTRWCTVSAGLPQQNRPDTGHHETLSFCSYATPARTAAGPVTDSAACAGIGSTGGLSTIPGAYLRSPFAFQSRPDLP